MMWPWMLPLKSDSLWEDKYKNLIIVVQIGEAVAAEKAAEKEHTSSQSSRIIQSNDWDRPPQVISYNYSIAPAVSITDFPNQVS